MGGVVLAGGDLQLALGGRNLVRLKEEQAVSLQVSLEGARVGAGGEGGAQLRPGRL
jgi:hypothetical protein